MITVAHLINNIVQSGPVIVMRDIIRHMDRDKFHPIVICLRHEEKEDPIVKELRAIDVKCIYLNYSLLSLELQTGRIARRFCLCFATRKLISSIVTDTILI